MKLPVQLGVSSSAGFGGKNNEYRYFLRRSWAKNLGTVLWIMLNPSTADSDYDDPTLAKIQVFTRLWGYGVCEVVNLFAWRSPSPDEMKRHAFPVGEHNMDHVERAAVDANLIVCAWGKDGAHMDRGDVVLATLRDMRLEPHALKLNKDGSPAHPLYLPFTCTPFKMEFRA